jgi:release factor glutamine methyltransferase
LARSIALIACSAAVLGALACGARREPPRPVADDFIEVEYPPPPAQVEEMSEELAGRPECIWQDGHYEWSGRRYRWIPGQSPLLHAAALVPSRAHREPSRRRLCPSSPVPDTTQRAAMSQPESWSIGSVLRWASEDFAKRGNPSPRLDAELLLGHALGLDRVRLILDSARPLAEAELAAFRALIIRRRKGEPIAYIRGEREFYGRRFVVDRRVLVPRPDTETLVEVALTRTRERALYGRALDLCTGSGCVAITFALERRNWRVTGVDLSGDALAVARENALRLGSVWGLRWLIGDLFATLEEDERFELITANPPYIPAAEIAALDADVREFEPRLALDGGADGLAVIRRIAEGALERLQSGGILALEVGHDQAPAVEALFAQLGYTQLERKRDYGGHERVVSGVKA